MVSNTRFACLFAMILSPTRNTHTAVATVEPIFLVCAAMSITSPTFAIDMKSTPMLIERKLSGYIIAIAYQVALSTRVKVNPEFRYRPPFQNSDVTVNLRFSVFDPSSHEMNSRFDLNGLVKYTIS